MSIKCLCTEWLEIKNFWFWHESEASSVCKWNCNLGSLGLPTLPNRWSGCSTHIPVWGVPNRARFPCKIEVVKIGKQWEKTCRCWWPSLLHKGMGDGLVGTRSPPCSPVLSSRKATVTVSSYWAPAVYLALWLSILIAAQLNSGRDKA